MKTAMTLFVFFCCFAVAGTFASANGGSGNHNAEWHCPVVKNIETHNGIVIIDPRQEL